MNRYTEKGLGITAILLSVIVLVTYVIYSATAGVLQSPDNVAEGLRPSVVERIKPIGHVTVKNVPQSTTSAAPTVAKAARSGQAVFDAVCTACHSTGAAGAPIVGNKEQWAPRIATGLDTLLISATNGKGAMPPKGTCMDCSADELKATIEYMTTKSQ